MNITLAGGEVIETDLETILEAELVAGECEGGGDR